MKPLKSRATDSGQMAQTFGMESGMESGELTSSFQHCHNQLIQETQH